MKKLNLIIADDHPIFLKGLWEGLEMEEDFTVIAQATNGQEAFMAVQTYRPDVVVLDIDMPRMNGLEAAEKMLEINPQLPIILLTMHKEKAPLLKALELGICGYVLKENAVTDIMHAIRIVAAGNPYISPEMSLFLLRKPQNTAKQKTQEVLELLTPAERQITQLVAQYKTSKEIADELFISEKTVFNHRMNIAKKLNLTGKNSLLRFALEHFA
ncbi:response regulator transcription factor [Adhaeribacter pallidiroseus]|uniref:Transcriptional regulatory protein DegU n=1 Tax=Adhaeribacter pallidiroseus TaxID=2072847 RepID=A0A369QJZ2_9BACT|nr:response regulator transcription factor [Adhaeribacter pallidiroseus]RDC63557.1 Transcriptional regulatory protein DegU [Adhaeribacter pallidiroseus]